MAKTRLCGVFFAEVASPEGPTGEFVFCDGAMLEDYGGNKLAGPFKRTDGAIRRKRDFVVPCQFRPVPGTIHRDPKYIPHPGHTSVDCGFVTEDDITG